MDTTQGPARAAAQRKRQRTTPLVHYTRHIQRQINDQEKVQQILDDVHKNYAAMYQLKRMPGYHIDNRKSKPIPTKPGGSRMLKGPMHLHPDAHIKMGAPLQELVLDPLLNPFLEAYNPAATPEVSTTGGRLERLVGIWHTASALKILSRFLSAKQVKLQKMPHKMEFRPPGVPHEVDAERDFRTMFLRALRLPGMITTMNPRAVLPNAELSYFDYSRLSKLWVLYYQARLLLEWEMESVTPDPQDRPGPEIYLPDVNDPDHIRVECITRARDTLWTILNSMLREAGTRTTVMALSYGYGMRQMDKITDEQAYQYNMGPGGVGMLQRMLKKYDEEMKSHPQLSLIMDLLGMEDRFEKSLTVEHVEDKLINKQVALLDEEELTRTYTGYSLGWLARHVMNESNEENYVYRVLADIALVNRQRRNYRLIRDWEGGRPWRRMYQLYDSREAGKEWLRGAIESLRNDLYREVDTPVPLAKTSYLTVLPRLLGIKPLDIATIEPAKCFLCREKLEGNKDFESTVLVLSACNHYFHLTCIFGYWDLPGMNCHRCPVCMRVGPLNIETVDFSVYEDGSEPFVHNVYGYREKNNSHDPFLYNPQTPYTTLGLPAHVSRKLKRYDLPQEPRNYVRRENPDRNDYWAMENELVATIDDALFQVVAGSYKPGVTATDPRWNIQADPFPRRMRDQWIAMRQHLPMYEGRDLLDKSTFRSFPPTRFAPEAEAAFLRRNRRRRDMERRRQVERSGLTSLNPKRAYKLGIARWNPEAE